MRFENIYGPVHVLFFSLIYTPPFIRAMRKEFSLNMKRTLHSNDRNYVAGREVFIANSME